MRKVLVSFALAASLFASGNMYSENVKDVYIDGTSAKSIGKLLPTNAVKILATEGDRVKLSVKGYVNPAAANVVYFSPTERIIAVAFAKTATPDIKVIKKGEGGKWDEVEATIYTKKDGFTSDLKALFNKGETLYKDSCGVCHGLHQTTHYKANQWPSLLKSMINRTPISKDDEWLVSQFLQKHSADVNVGKK